MKSSLQSMLAQLMCGSVASDPHSWQGTAAGSGTSAARSQQQRQSTHQSQRQTHALILLLCRPNRIGRNTQMRAVSLHPQQFQQHARLRTATPPLVTVTHGPYLRPPAAVQG